ncbi:MAG: C2 family cysteine protease [Pirellulaceae bacterium]
MPHHKNGLLVIPKGAHVVRYGNPVTPANSKSHHRTYHDLFPQPPSQTDVVQGSIGDCYLMSALHAILGCPTGPAAIEECMLDRGSGGLSGEVVVRFYDQGLAPQYISITKTVVTGLGARNTIWVKLFEKAYAAFFLNRQYAELESKAGHQHGRASDVFRAILGSDAETYGCVQNHADFMKLMGLTSGNRSPNLNKQVRENVFAGNGELLEAWKNWYTQQKAMAWTNTKGAGCVVVRFEDYERFLQGAGADMPVNVREHLADWIKTEGILPGRRGTGIYSAHQREIYTKIKNALAAKKPVSVGSNSSVAKSAKIIGKGLAGEGKAQSGLVGQHQYSLLRAKDEEGLCWVELHNPWNDWGVRYERGIHRGGHKDGLPYLRPVNDPAAGTFWLELCDLTKHFKSVFVGGQELR